jgi:hypothetical protein
MWVKGWGIKDWRGGDWNGVSPFFKALIYILSVDSGASGALGAIVSERENFLA